MTSEFNWRQLPGELVSALVGMTPEFRRNFEVSSGSIQVSITPNGGKKNSLIVVLSDGSGTADWGVYDVGNTNQALGPASEVGTPEFTEEAYAQLAEQLRQVI